MGYPIGSEAGERTGERYEGRLAEDNPGCLSMCQTTDRAGVIPSSGAACRWARVVTKGELWSELLRDHQPFARCPSVRSPRRAAPTDR